MVQSTVSYKRHWLWRAVDQDGCVLDEIAQSRRKRAIDEEAGMLAEAHSLLTSFAPMELHDAVEHRSHKGLNKRKRERTMQGFRSSGGLQRFLSVLSAVRNLFVPPHSKHSASAVHLPRLRAIAHWKAVTETAA